MQDRGKMPLSFAAIYDNTILQPQVAEMQKQVGSILMVFILI